MTPLDRAWSPSQFARAPEATLADQQRRGRALCQGRAPLSRAPLSRASAQVEDAGFDLFVPEGDGPWPVVAFIHGGYWQYLDRSALHFMASPLLDHGIAFASLGYGLAPTSTLAAMEDHCLASLEVLSREAPGLGLGALALGGHSAGAQLACRVAMRAVRTPVGRLAIEELHLVSGVFDLRPLVPTYVNDVLGLDEDAARAASPLFSPLGGLPPVFLSVAEEDPPGFHAQAEAFGRALEAHGVAVSLGRRPDCDHFTILDHPSLFSWRRSRFAIPRSTRQIAHD